MLKITMSPLLRNQAIFYLFWGNQNPDFKTVLSALRGNPDLHARYGSTPLRPFINGGRSYGPH